MSNESLTNIEKKILAVLADRKWHCAHELSALSSQSAKPLQLLRQKGYQFEKIGNQWTKHLLCKSCQRSTPHRRLLANEPLARLPGRVPVSPAVRKRVLHLLRERDAIFDATVSTEPLEIDHRVPQVRWSSDEVEITVETPDDVIKDKFMLLTRSHNLLKDKQCRRCRDTGTRQPFLGVEFFHKGDSDYREKTGCVGCGWHNPEKWRIELQKQLDRKK